MINRYRRFSVYLLAIPLAVLLGILAATPDGTSAMLVMALVGCLALPLVAKWHHVLLIAFWNSVFGFFFLPGEVSFWLFFSFFSFGLVLIHRVMGRQRFISLPVMTRPLLFMAVTVVLTAFYRGGIGIRSLGASSHGGRNYIYILGGILGYLAMTAQFIPLEKSRRMTALFFVSPLSGLISNLAYALGTRFYILYCIVPASSALLQAANDVGLNAIERVSGLGAASSAAVCLLLAGFGLRGLLDYTRPWRMVALVLAVAAGLFAGFRTALITDVLILGVQFCLEGLYRTRVALVALCLGVVGCVGLYFGAAKLPLSVQRAISFLPVDIDSVARSDAAESVDWRLQMWKIVWGEAPAYLVVGKGYGVDPATVYLTSQAVRWGILPSYEEALLAGDYHSGPLSLLIPFGLMGVVAFIWVIGAGFWVLYSNYRWGPESLRTVNTVLLSYYAATFLIFVFVFGSFCGQFFYFLGAIGLGVSLNGGMARNPRRAMEMVRRPAGQAFAIEVE